MHRILGGRCATEQPGASSQMERASGGSRRSPSRTSTVPSQSAAVIGAGVAGLQAARALARGRCTSVTIFEREDDVGGVWRSNYVGYAAQVVRSQYHLPESDSSALDAYPRGSQLAEHTRSFADSFLQCGGCSIMYATEVKHVRRASGRWLISYRTRRNDRRRTQDEATIEVDIVVVAVGLFSRPLVPLQGAEQFAGRSMHSSELVDLEVLRGRRVLVVGMGKSACDLIMAAACVAKSVDAIAREPVWLIPRHFLGFEIRWFTSTRCFAAIVLAARTWAISRAVQYCLWALLEFLLLRWYFRRVPPAWRPARGALRAQLWNGRSLAIVDAPSLQNALRAPHVRCLRAEPHQFCHDGLMVRARVDGELRERRLVADVIIWATGYDSRGVVEGMFDEVTLGQLQRRGRERDPQDRGLALYRRMVPVSDNLQGLAFVGRVLSSSDITVSFVQAEWFASLCSGQLKLPRGAVREEEAQQCAVEQQRFPLARSGHAEVSLPMIHTYLDKLVSDITAARQQARHSGVARYLRSTLRFFRPLHAADYAVLLQ
mmetsp:Transcript_26940/g.85720  ORF Transcript_26940/g.85720 Transcript_26940/m.85720 type:complete len:545 (-) Transcript_26940:512-2146(-)